MKRIFKMMALLLCLTATAGMIGCSKDDSSSSTTSSTTENGGDNSGGGNSGGGSQEETYPLNDTRWVSGYFTLVFNKTDGSFICSNPEGSYTQKITYTYDSSTGRGEIKRNVGGPSQWQTKSFTVNGNSLSYLNMTFIKQ